MAGNVLTLPPPWQTCTDADLAKMLLAAIDRGGLLILTCERCARCYVGHHGSRCCGECLDVKLFA